MSGVADLRAIWSFPELTRSGHTTFKRLRKDYFSMLDIIALFQALLEIILDLGRLSGRKLLQPMLTAICLTGAYTAVHVGQEGSLGAGLRTAFLDGESARLVQIKRRSRQAGT